LKKTKKPMFFAYYPIQGEASESVPKFRPILLRKLF